MWAVDRKLCGADPDLLAKSPTRRARVARESGKEEREVAEMMAAFAQMRQQMQLLLQGGVPGALAAGAAAAGARLGHTGALRLCIAALALEAACPCWG